MRPYSKWLAMLAIATSLFVSCDDDKDDIIPDDLANLISFGATEYEITAAEEQIIDIQFAKTAPKAGELLVQVPFEFSTYFESNPAVNGNAISFPITKGATGLEWKIKPVAIPSEDISFDVMLKGVTVPFLIKQPHTLKIMLKKNASVARSIADFSAEVLTVSEHVAGGVQVVVNLSRPAATDSKVILTVESATAIYLTHFTTAPAVEEGRIAVDVKAGDTQAIVRLIPVANNVITGEFEINVNIESGTGAIEKGTVLQKKVTIKDAELAGRAKGYETSNGTDSYQEFYEYRADGKLSKVRWEQWTGFRREGVDEYKYDAAGRLMSIRKNNVTELTYTWQQDRMVRVENITNGVKASYTEIDYDAAGNVGATASYHRQPDGSYLKGLIGVYLYFTNGNIHKFLLYQPLEGAEEPVLVSTKTYDGYSDEVNSFPMLEIIPTQKTQQNLASYYSVEENNMKSEYNLSYEYAEDGRPSKRTARSGNDSQRSTYYYY